MNSEKFGLWKYLPRFWFKKKVSEKVVGKLFRWICPERKGDRTGEKQKMKRRRQEMGEARKTATNDSH